MTNDQRNKLFGFDAECPNDIPVEEMLVVVNKKYTCRCGKVHNSMASYAYCDCSDIVLSN